GVGGEDGSRQGLRQCGRAARAMRADDAPADRAGEGDVQLRKRGQSNFPVTNCGSAPTDLFRKNCSDPFLVGGETMRTMILAAALAVSGAALAQQQTCFPSKFGPTDQVGNLNNVTPEKTLAATRLVTKGKAYRLGIETNKNTPAFPPRTFN